MMHKAYWEGYRHPTHPGEHRVDFENPEDIDYLGVTQADIRRNVLELRNQGMLDKVLEGSGRPTEKLIATYESTLGSHNDMPTKQLATTPSSPIQRAKKDTAIPVALIGAVAVVIAAVIGYFATHPNKPDSGFIDYTVRVKDAKSFRPIVGAKVNLAEDQKAPQPYFTDSDGIIYVNNLSKDTKTISLEVMASGYQSQARNGLLAHTGSQDFMLETLPPPQQPEKRPDPLAKPVSVNPKNDGQKEVPKEDVTILSAQDIKDFQNESSAHTHEVYGDTIAEQSISYMYCGLQGCNKRPPNQADIDYARKLWVSAVSEWTLAYNTTHNPIYSDRLREKIRPESGVSCDDHSCESNSTHENRSFGIHIPTNLFDPQ